MSYAGNTGPRAQRQRVATYCRIISRWAGGTPADATTRRAASQASSRSAELRSWLARSGSWCRASSASASALASSTVIVTRARRSDSTHCASPRHAATSGRAPRPATAGTGATVGVALAGVAQSASSTTPSTSGERRIRKAYREAAGPRHRPCGNASRPWSERTVRREPMESTARREPTQAEP